MTGGSGLVIILNKCAADHAGTRKELVTVEPLHPSAG
jgi:hypothetical protein